MHRLISTRTVVMAVLLLAILWLASVLVVGPLENRAFRRQVVGAWSSDGPIFTVTVTYRQDGVVELDAPFGSPRFGRWKVVRRSTLVIYDDDPRHPSQREHWHFEAGGRTARVTVTDPDGTSHTRVYYRPR